jgi:Aldo/keto reductase family
VHAAAGPCIVFAIAVAIWYWSVQTANMRIQQFLCNPSQIHWPDRYVQLFGEAMYDINQVRSDDVPFEEQLRGLENVVKAGKVPLRAQLIIDRNRPPGPAAQAATVLLSHRHMVLHTLEPSAHSHSMKAGGFTVLLQPFPCVHSAGALHWRVQRDVVGRLPVPCGRKGAWPAKGADDPELVLAGVPRGVRDRPGGDVRNTQRKRLAAGTRSLRPDVELNGSVNLGHTACLPVMLSMTTFCTPPAQAYSPLAGGSLTGKYQDGGNSTSRFNLFPGASCVLHCLLLSAASSPALPLEVALYTEGACVAMQATWSGSTRQGCKLYLAWLATPACSMAVCLLAIQLPCQPCPVCAHLSHSAPQSLARQAVAEYVKVADKYGLTPSELALAWCDSRWFVASTIIGATSLDQLKVP